MSFSLYFIPQVAGVEIYEIQDWFKSRLMHNGMNAVGDVEEPDDKPLDHKRGFRVFSDNGKVHLRLDALRYRYHDKVPNNVQSTFKMQYTMVLRT